MEEPSVLDYIKEKLTFWKESSIKVPPPLEEETSFGDSSVNMHDSDRMPLGEDMGQGEKPPRSVGYWPSGLFLILSSLILALIAQSLLEPPGRIWKVGMFVYAIAALLIGAAYFRDHVAFATVSEDDQDASDFSFYLPELVVGLVLMVLTFLFFGSKSPAVPKFQLINSGLWIASIGYLIRAFWFRHQVPDGLELRRKLVNLFSAQSWSITLTRWGLLVLVAAGLILFFRFYRLGTIPAEMFSDHAEKLLDVNDVLNGQLNLFFPRNTGREAFQFYLTALVAKVFQTGISYLALKLGTVICGLITLVYIYRLGNEIGNRWVALFALLFAGFSYWANVQSRIGLRFPLYPFFLAPTLFHLIRGLRRMNRNDFIFAGLWLGLGLHGYTADRIIPFVVVVGIAIYLLHKRSRDQREFALWALVIVALVALAVFMPLLRLTIDQPDLVVYRSLTRMADLERPLPGPAGQIFLKNTWNALMMFFWDDGEVWVHSIPHRPALDVISAGIFFLGLVLVTLRYIRKRSWVDLFLLVSIPILLLPSILSLAFPNENPNLNRTAGAYVPAFLIVAVGLEGMLSAVKRSLPPPMGRFVAVSLGLLLVILSAAINFGLVFNQYATSFRNNAWNTSELGQVIGDFSRSMGSEENAWVVAFPHWVDTRLVGINAGFPTRDTAIDPAMLDMTLSNPNAKLFLVNIQDVKSLALLQELYPEGRYWIYPSQVPSKEFVVFYVPPLESLLPR